MLKLIRGDVMLMIGYQGVEGSNSEEAAKQLAIKNRLKEYTLLPLVSSFNVLDNVLKHRIDYGVIAVKNSKGGYVKESMIVLEKLKLKKVDEITIPITHHLFVKSERITKKDIQYIASHPQAFKQCKNNLENNYNKAILLGDEDTATAARKLSLGIFKDDTAVLCRLNAGKMNDLFLLERNLEDTNDNKTTFEMY